MIPEEKEEASNKEEDEVASLLQSPDISQPHPNTKTGDDPATGSNELPFQPKKPPGRISLDVVPSTVKVENQADDTTALPAPNLILPPSSSSTPKARTIRAVPSLPAGFSGLLARRSPASPLAFRLGGDNNNTNSGLSLVTSLNDPSSSNNDRNSAFAPPDLISPTAELLSPRAAEFTATPFRRSAAGDLAGSTFLERGLLSPPALETDPRSPPAAVGEGPVRRNIEDVL